jgi:hypothetical protein
VTIPVFVFYHITQLYFQAETNSYVMSINWYGLTPMAHQEPAAHLNIIYQTHMEDIQWSGGNGYGFKATNGISFGPDLLAKCQTFSPVMSKNWHGMTPMAHQEPGNTPQHHLSDPNGGYSMVWRQWISLQSVLARRNR